MSTYNVYIGENLIMKEVPDYDIKHKLEYITEYFKHYPSDDLRTQEIKVVKNWRLYNKTLDRLIDRCYTYYVLITCYGKRIYSKSKCSED